MTINRVKKIKTECICVDLTILLLYYLHYIIIIIILKYPVTITQYWLSMIAKLSQILPTQGFLPVRCGNKRILFSLEC